MLYLKIYYRPTYHCEKLPCVRVKNYHLQTRVAVYLSVLQVYIIVVSPENQRSKSYFKFFYKEIISLSLDSATNHLLNIGPLYGPSVG